MTNKLPGFLLVLCLCCQTVSAQPFFIKHGSVHQTLTDVTDMIDEYVGRFHKSPQDINDIIYLVNEYNEQNGSRLKTFISGIDMLKTISKHRITPINGVCIITRPHRNWTMVTDADIDSWLKNDYYHFAIHYRPALYDAEGNYLWKESDDACDSLTSFLSMKVKEDSEYIRTKAMINSAEYDVPYRVHVLYRKNNGISLMNSNIYMDVPDNMFSPSDMPVYLNQLFFWLEEYFEKYPPIASMDAYLPLFRRK